MTERNSNLLTGIPWKITYVHFMNCAQKKRRIYDRAIIKYLFSWSCWPIPDDPRISIGYSYASCVSYAQRHAMMEQQQLHSFIHSCSRSWCIDAPAWPGSTEFQSERRILPERWRSIHSGQWSYPSTMYPWSGYQSSRHTTVYEHIHK